MTLWEIENCQVNEIHLRYHIDSASQLLILFSLAICSEMILFCIPIRYQKEKEKQTAFINETYRKLFFTFFEFFYYISDIYNKMYNTGKITN